MKLISVTSRGNRLAMIESSAQVDGVGFFKITLKSMGYRRFLTRDYKYSEWKTLALKTAAVWLKGAQE